MKSYVNENSKACSLEEKPRKKVSSWPALSHGCPVEFEPVERELNYRTDLLAAVPVRDSNSKKKIVMAGLDPATQPPRVREAKRPLFSEAAVIPSRGHATRWVAGSRFACPAMTDIFVLELNRTALALSRPPSARTSVRARDAIKRVASDESSVRADARPLGGWLKAGHDEFLLDHNPLCPRAASQPEKIARNPIHHAITSADLRRFCHHAAVTCDVTEVR